MKSLLITVFVIAALFVATVPAMAQTTTPPPANPLMFLPLISQPLVPSTVTGTAVLPSPTTTLPPAQSSTTVYIPMM